MTSSFATQYFLRQAENNAWANQRLLDACADLTADELVKRRPSFFGTLLSALNHIITVDWYYLDALTEGGRGRSIYPDNDPFGDIPSLTLAQAKSDAHLIEFCKSLTDADLTRTVKTERPHDPQWREEIGDLLLHLFQHQIHHRGQVHDMLSATPVAPPQLDEFFLAMDRINRSD